MKASKVRRAVRPRSGSARLSGRLVVAMTLVVIVTVLSSFVFNSVAVAWRLASLPPEVRERLREERPAGPPARFRRTFTGALGAAALFSAAFGTLLALGVARGIARPIESVSEAAGRVTNGDLGARAPEDGGGRELTALARDFNRMAASLERLEAERKHFIADIAHELRTPLTILQGRLDGLADGLFPLTQEEVAGLSRQTELLTRLVEDLRTLSLADAGKLDVHPREVDAARLVRDTAAGFSPRAAARGQALVVDAEPDLPAVRADPDRFAQVLANLLDNALRFTPDGGTVRVDLYRAGRCVRLAVRDSGPGLSDDERARVFERFVRGDGARDRPGGGSGLGLAIVRTLAELHGGRVRALRASGGGAHFEVEWPLDDPREDREG